MLRVVIDLGYENDRDFLGENLDLIKNFWSAITLFNEYERNFEVRYVPNDLSEPYFGRYDCLIFGDLKE